MTHESYKLVGREFILVLSGGSVHSKRRGRYMDDGDREYSSVHWAGSGRVVRIQSREEFRFNFQTTEFEITVYGEPRRIVPGIHSLQPLSRSLEDAVLGCEEDSGEEFSPIVKNYRDVVDSIASQVFSLVKAEEEKLGDDLTVVEVKMPQSEVEPNIDKDLVRKTKSGQVVSKSLM